MKKLKQIWSFLKTPKGWGSLLGAWLAFWVLTGLASPVVEVSGVKKHDAVWAVAGTVRVLPKEDLLVRSRLAGQVADIKSLEASGKSVIGKDEAIASLEAEELDNEIALFKSRYELLKQRMEIGSTVEPEIQSAREDMAVYEELYKTGQFSQSDLDKRRRELEKLERVWYNSRLDDEAALAGLEFELKSRLTRREAMTLKSPIEGYLTETYVIPGQSVTPEAPIARVRSRELLIEVSVSEEDFAGIALGQEVRLNFTGIHQTFVGHVARLSDTYNSDTRRRVLYASLNEPQELNPGATGYATVIKAVRPDALIIPRRALQGDRVYVEIFGTLYSRKVKLGFQNFDTVEVLEGLSIFDSVALGGGVELKNNLRIRGKRL